MVMMKKVYCTKSNKYRKFPKTLKKIIFFPIKQFFLILVKNTVVKIKKILTKEVWTEIIENLGLVNNMNE